MNKLKKFFRTIWGYITYPYYWVTTRKLDKKLTKIAEKDRMSLITEKDIEFLKNISVETDWETLK